ncbi:MAG TPA: nucleotide sugar dehydrogenase [Fibrobacteria bacterium]|nr:nucleotide sugar dehydrogenase [Fibrobacteria bacterium]
MIRPPSLESIRIGVVGLGYVGLPLAAAFGSRFPTLGFDVQQERIDALRRGDDRTGELDPSELMGIPQLRFSSEPADLGECNFFIVCVPTPVDRHKRPDLTPLLSATTAIGRHLTTGSVVVYESTVYPGCTEEDCAPLLERESGLRANHDFWLGYSPERINPGDKEHTFRKIRKVVSGSTPEALDAVDAVYSSVVEAGTHRAPSIRVAEAAKVIENSQRDLNIAFVNELALIFHRLGLDVGDVLEAAGTKWNFLPFRPGLVGGHCIGVDPYYLTHKALETGYHPEVILAGRKINDGMGTWIAQECIRLLIDAGRPLKGARVLVLGLSFKENVPDIRNTKVIDIVRELERFGIRCAVVDPFASPEDAKHEYGIDLVALGRTPRCDACVAAVAHDPFASLLVGDFGRMLEPGAPILDVKSFLDEDSLEKAGFRMWRL